jgi:ribosomal protein S18 acetylase RimI-like enzyme
MVREENLFTYSMSTESNIAVVQYSHAAFNAGDLNGVEGLTTKDAAWASEILRQAFHTDPLLNFIYGDTINAPGKLNWFFRVTFRLAALYGECFSTAEKDGVLMMLPPDQTKMTLGKMYKSGFLAAPFKMGWASFSRMMTFMDFAEKEHKAATAIDHYYIMTVGVLPERQGMGIGKKLMTKALEINTNRKFLRIKHRKEQILCLLLLASPLIPALPFFVPLLLAECISL